jgi:hypothetical protein
MKNQVRRIEDSGEFTNLYCITLLRFEPPTYFVHEVGWSAPPVTLALPMTTMLDMGSSVG